MKASFSEDGVSSVSAIVAISLVSFVFAVLEGNKLILYQRYAWVPQLLVVFALIGVAGPQFASHAGPGSGKNIMGRSISFFSLTLSTSLTYSTTAADYFARLPQDAPRPRLFFGTLTGLWMSFGLLLVVDIGLGSGCTSNPGWKVAYARSPGALIPATFEPLGRFGRCCCLALVFGTVAPITAGTYSLSLTFQATFDIFHRVPRFGWTVLVTVLTLPDALLGWQHLADILPNFPALMGYWVSV